MILTDDEKRRRVIRVIDRLIIAHGAQKAVASLLEVAEGTLSKWKSGKAPISGVNLHKILTLSKLAADDLASSEEVFASLLLNNIKNLFRTSPQAELSAVEKNRPVWLRDWVQIKGTYKYFYTHRSGVIEISEISFIGIQSEGITTVMTNWDTKAQTKELRWSYRGLSYIMEGHLYAMLSEEREKNELFFLICRLSAGAPGEALYGHLLVKGRRANKISTATSPCILLQVDPEHADIHGTFTLQEVLNLRLLSPDMIEHLTDAPTLELRRQVELLNQTAR